MLRAMPTVFFQVRNYLYILLSGLAFILDCSLDEQPIILSCYDKYRIFTMLLKLSINLSIEFYTKSH